MSLSQLGSVHVLSLVLVPRFADVLRIRIVSVPTVESQRVSVVQIQKCLLLLEIVHLSAAKVQIRFYTQSGPSRGIVYSCFVLLCVSPHLVVAQTVIIFAFNPLCTGHRFSPVVFPGILSPCLPFLVHLRSSSLLHHFAISLSALAPSPVLLNKVFRSPSDMFLYNMMRVSENSVESCFWSLSDAKMGALLSQTLVGLDSNPEKNEELVLTIYRAIPDLKLASAIQQFGSVLWNSDSPSELSVVFQVVGKEQGLDDFESCLLASKLWLEKHTGRFPNLITHWAESHCDSMELLYEYDKVLRLGDYGLDSFKDLQRKGISVCGYQCRDSPAFQQDPFPCG